MIAAVHTIGEVTGRVATARMSGSSGKQRKRFIIRLVEMSWATVLRRHRFTCEIDVVIAYALGPHVTGAVDL